MARPRLLFLLPALKQKPETGGEIYNARLAEGLAQDWDLTVLDFDSLPGFARREDAYARAVQTALTDAPAFDVVLQDTYGYAFQAEANQWLSRRVPLVGFGQAVYSERFGRPWHRWWHDRAMRRAITSYSGLIVVSDAMRDHAARLGMRSERIEVVAPGYSLAGNVPEPARDDRLLRIVSAGSYQPAKGQLTVVRAVARLLDRKPELKGKVRLDMYGNLGFAPDYVEQVRAAASSNPESIAIHGPIPQAELWDAFARSHIFAFLAQGEGVGMVTVEAMACGAAPLLADDRLSRDLLGTSDAGICVAPTVDEASRGLEKLIFDLDGRSARAANRGAELVVPWSTTVGRFSEAIRRLMA